MGKTNINDGSIALGSPWPCRPQTVNGPERRVDPASEVLVVLLRQICISMEVFEQVLVCPVGDVEGGFGGRDGVVAVGYQVVRRLDQDIAQELCAKVYNVGEMLVLVQSCRRRRVGDDAGLRLDEYAIGDCEPDYPCEVV